MKTITLIKRLWRESRIEHRPFLAVLREAVLFGLDAMDSARREDAYWDERHAAYDNLPF